MGKGLEQYSSQSTKICSCNQLLITDDLIPELEVKTKGLLILHHVCLILLSKPSHGSLGKFQENNQLASQFHLAGSDNPCCLLKGFLMTMYDNMIITAALHDVIPLCGSWTLF